MCVAALSWRAHPRWRLVAIGNRDEYHARPAAPLARWDAGGLIAGRDEKSGGTWLGVSEGNKRFALVTNRRGFGDPAADKLSRGQLVTDYVSASGDFADPSPASLDAFNPFNLLTADTERAHFLTNRPDPVRAELTPGIYGLSNGSLDEPWPKTLFLKAALLEWLNDEDDPEALFAALSCEEQPDIGPYPAVPSDIYDEARDTAPFIRDRVYGTRCSTVVAIATDGAGLIAERRFSATGHAMGTTQLAFSW